MDVIVHWENKRDSHISHIQWAIITSWASFPFELALEGVTKQVLHLPCMSMPDMMDVCIAFKPQPGRLGVLYLAKRAKPGVLQAGDGTPLGGTIDAGIFPLKE